MWVKFSLGINIRKKHFNMFSAYFSRAVLIKMKGNYYAKFQQQIIEVNQNCYQVD